ncbi:MAG: hypothetical protein V3S29_04345 [bacterium]
MAQTVPSSWKNCVTCYWWEGVRVLAQPYRNQVKVDDLATTGLCQSGEFSGFEMVATNTCDSFRKWGDLK